ncbi:hypothetical protein DPMN_144288 [Dreissena polymorpha]|uniref:Uncharacterized protein n=1 Tax=Dreissena polymorpha TaxID=45954 RepID=A0A9D4GF55_DREPO|nr:hypothetical protein DPMN_144288 [Dreissena polymorpha]
MKHTENQSINTDVPGPYAAATLTIPDAATDRHGSIRQFLISQRLPEPKEHSRAFQDLQGGYKVHMPDHAGYDPYLCVIYIGLGLKSRTRTILILRPGSSFWYNS